PGSGVAVRRDARLAAETDGDADSPADARRIARLDAEPEDELLPEHVVDRIDRAGQGLGEGAGQGDLAGAAAKLRVAAVRSGLGAWRAPVASRGRERQECYCSGAHRLQGWIKTS